MPEQYPIHDLYFRELEYHEIGDLARLPLLEYDDHLLRRFGYAEFIHAKAEMKINYDARQIADEIWALLEGSATFRFADTRADSPTHKSEFEYSSYKPLLLLVPFGVAFGFEVDDSEEALLIRFATHPPKGTNGLHKPPQRHA